MRETTGHVNMSIYRCVLSYSQEFIPGTYSGRTACTPLHAGGQSRDHSSMAASEVHRRPVFVPSSLLSFPCHFPYLLLSSTVVFHAYASPFQLCRYRCSYRTQSRAYTVSVSVYKHIYSVTLNTSLYYLSYPLLYLLS